MRLSEYLQETGTKPSAFAEKVGVAPSTVSRIINRERSMSLDMAVKMARATEGRVTIDDIIEEFSNDAGGSLVEAAGSLGGEEPTVSSRPADPPFAEPAATDLNDAAAPIAGVQAGAADPHPVAAPAVEMPEAAE